VKISGILVALGLWAASAAAAPHPFAPPAVWAAEYSSYERHAAYVPVADGTRLAVTWYLPAQGPAVTLFPVLLWYMPGHRENIDPRTGEIRPGMDLQELAFLTAHGYAVAIAEMRGSGASFGFRVLDRGPQIGLDGRDLVNWLAAQPWSTGEVGMIGVSYQGFTQFATAAQRPPALKAIFPEIAGFDDYTSLYFPGGILNTALARVAYAGMGRDDRNEYDPTATPPHLPSAPVVDENGDGRVVDDLPEYPQGRKDFLDSPPRYADGRQRADLYWNATHGHLQNGILTNERIANSRFRDSTLGTTPYRFSDLDPSEKPSQIAGSGIAVYNRGGWFDYHARDTTQWFGTLKGHVPDRLMMVPTGHTGLPPASATGPGHGNPYLALSGDDRSTSRIVFEEKLRFFDRYVRGIRNGFDNEAPVLLYVVGSGWRREDEWPPKRARTLRLSLAANGALTERAAEKGIDEWRVDPAAHSMSQGANRWNYGIGGVKAPLSLDATLSRRLAYTSAALPEDREITGHPIVELALGASAPSTDVYAYLEDVAPDGTSMLVTEGELRANFHRLVPPQAMMTGKPSVSVSPALPWHGYRAADFDPAPLADGRVVRLVFDLMPTAWRFRAGHRIRLSLAGADQDSFEPPADPAPSWRVHRGAGESVLLLPWVR
jgi:putative CocE/NonD family hydrolase